MATGVTVATTWLASVLAIIAANMLFPQPLGPSALGAILEPHLVLSAVLAGGIVWRRASVKPRVLVVTLIVVTLVRYGPAWLSVPPAPGDRPLTVATWNMLAGGDPGARVLAGVSTSRADLMAIQELKADSAAALDRFATRFPFRSLPPADTLADVGLLSIYPILDTELSSDPPILRAVVQPPSVQPIVVYVVHAPLSRFVRWGDIPVAVDLTARDRSIAEIRRRIEADLARGESVIVMGDVNTTERELMYATLSSGLRDAHLDAGIGPGFTWRPWQLATLPFGLVRIDYVLSTPDLQPTSSTVNCGVPSDHCRVDATLTMTRLVTQE